MTQKSALTKASHYVGKARVDIGKAWRIIEEAKVQLSKTKRTSPS